MREKRRKKNRFNGDKLLSHAPRERKFGGVFNNMIEGHV
jgi:hypothetical protein